MSHIISTLRAHSRSRQRRANAVEIAVEIDFEQIGGVVGGGTLAAVLHAVEAQGFQIEEIHEGVYHAHGIVFVDQRIQRGGEQAVLLAVGFVFAGHE